MLSPNTASVLARIGPTTSGQGPLGLVLWVFLSWILKLTLPVSQLAPSDLPELSVSPRCRGHSGLACRSDLPLWHPSSSLTVLFAGLASASASERSKHWAGTK